MVATNSGGTRNSPVKARKSALRLIGCELASSRGPCSSRRRRLPSAQRSRWRHRSPSVSTASSRTTASGASVTWRPCTDRRVESSRSSVSARSDHPPTASSAARRTNIPFPRSSAVPSVAHRPHWLAMSISCSSACARVSHETRALRGRRATWRASAPGITCPRPHGALEERRVDARIGIDGADDVAPEEWHGERQHGALRGRPAPRLAAPHADRRTARRGASAASPVPSSDPSSTTSAS